MQTTPKANNILGHFFALLGAVVLLAIATWVSASSSEQVQPLDNLATPRTGHTATALSDGRILITGGRDHDGNLVAASEIFDPETQTSSATGTLNTARVDHSATVLVDGRVLIAGGSDNSGPLSSAEIFDPVNPAAGFQVVASPMTAARTHHTATLLNNGNVLIAGGETAGTAEIFDPATQSFTPTLWNLSVARSGHTATLFTNDSVLLAGGNTASMEMYTPLDQKFTLDAAMLSVVRTGHWAFELSDTRLLLFQGDTGNSIDEFDPSTDTITPKGSLNFHASSSTLLANGKVLVLGTDVSGLYNPDAVPPAPDFTAFDETSVPHSGILPRSGQSAVKLSGDKKILISGGVDGNNQLLGQALFNPAKIWTDKDDYAPDEPVILSGSGWQANEPVHLFAVDNETEQWTYEMTVPADANGEFVLNPYFIVELRHAGVQFHVTAVGQSTMQADVYFTDAITLDSVTVGSQTGTLTAGTAGSATYAVCVAYHGNNSTISFSVTSALPAGVTASFAPASILNPSVCPATASTLTLTTTAAAVAGSYPFTVQATGGGTVTTTGTLVIGGGAATTTTVTSSLNPSVYNDSVTFTATVTRTSGSGTPTGNVNFNIAGIGTVAGTAGGTTANTATWTYTTSALTAGNHSVSAAFTHTGSFQDSSGTLSGGQTVNKATPTATLSVTNSPVTYNGSPQSAIVSISASSVSGTVANVKYNGSGAAPTNAATYAVTADFVPNDTANYNTLTTQSAGSFIIQKANPTATLAVTNSPATYNGLPQSATVGISTSSVPGTVANILTGGAATKTNAGTYAVTADFVPTDTTNYNTLTGLSAGNFVINKANATFTVTPYTCPTTTYTGLTHTATVSTITGVNGETGATVGTVDVTDTIHTAAGIYNGDQWTFTGTANYNRPSGTVDDCITKAHLTVTADDKSRAYGAANPTFTAAISGFVNGETVAVVSGSPTFSGTGPSSTATTTVGNYVITPATGTLSATNYDFTSFIDGTLTITKAHLTVTADDKSRTYGAANPTFTATFSGFVNGDLPAVVSGSPTFSGTGPSSTATTTVGNYVITPATGTLSATNYDFTSFIDGTLTITKAHLTVTADDKSRTYGAANPTFTATFSGFVNGDLPAVVSGSPTFSGTGPSSTATTTVGNYVITPAAGTLSATNYDFTSFIDGTLTITKAHLTVTADDKNRTYGAANPTFTATFSGFVNGDLPAVVSGSPTFSGTGPSSTATTTVGNYVITPAMGTLSATNYDFTTFIDGTLTITKAHLTVTADDKSRAYGAANPTFTATFSGFVNGDLPAVVSGSPTFSGTGPSSTATTTVGNYVITPAMGTLSATNYDFTTFIDGTLTITKAHLTVTADDKSRAYGAANPAFTATFSGFVNGDLPAVVSGSPAFSGTGPSSTATTTVGNYVITPAVGTLSATNYDFASFVDGTLTITKAHLTVTADDKSRAYGAANPTFTATFSGFVNGDLPAVVSGSPTFSGTGPSSTATTTVGNYVITPEAGTLSATNYDFTSFIDGTLTITKAHLTVTADDKSRAYGAANPAFTATFSGFVNGDLPAVVSGSPTFSGTGPSSTATTTVGNYVITPATGTLSATNYDFTSFIDGTLTITKAHLTVTADDKSRAYGAANPTFTATFSGFVNGDLPAVVSGSPTFSGTGPSSTATTTVGNYVITPAAGTLSATNYDFTSFIDGTLTITKAHLTVTADDKSRAYGAANPTFTATFSGFVNGDLPAVVSGSPTFSGTGPSSTATTTVGNYVITPGTGTLSATNYDFTTFIDGTLTITKAHLTVTADDKSRAYGAANPTFTATFSGFVNGDLPAVVSGSPTFSGTGPSSTATTTVGNYVITPAMGTLSATNYDFTTFIDGTLTITKAHLTVTADDKSRAYGAANPTFTATFSGFVNGDLPAVVSGSPTFSGTGPSSTATTTVGNYVITPAVGTLSATNYDFTSFIDGTLTITKAHLTVTADDKSRAYGAANPTFTATFSGFVNGDLPGVVSGSPAFSGTGPSSTATTTVGNYVITPATGTLSATNYDFTSFIDGTLTITKAHLTVTADDKSRTYGAANPTFTAMISGFVNGETVAVVSGSPIFSGTGPSSTATTTVGNYVITPEAGTLSATNYDFTSFVNGTLTITKVHLTVTADDKSKSYDGSVYSPFTATITGFVNSETVAVVSGSPSFSGSAVAAIDAGSYTITPAVGTLSATNYDFTSFVDGTLTITKVHLTVTADDKSKPYDGSVYSPFTATITGFVNSETAAVVSGSPSFSGSAVAAIDAGSYTITPAVGTLSATNYDFTSFVDGTLTITKVHLTVTADDKSRAYGAANPTFTATITGFVNGETIAVVSGSPTFSGTGPSSTATTTVGDYVITPAVGTLSATNYDFTPFVNGTLHITKAHLVVTADDKSRAYGAANPTFTAMITGFVNGETVAVVSGSPTFSGSGPSSTATTTVGDYVITPAVGTLSATNYDFTPFVNGTLTITKVHLTVTADDKSRAYGAANPTFTATITGFVNGETVAVVSGSPAFSGTGPSSTATTTVGNYVITPAVGTLSATNYDFTPFVNGTLTVTKVHLTVTADNKSRAYGAANPTFTATITGFVNGETVAVVSGSPTFSGTGTSSTATTTVGNYVITPVLGTLSATNYDFTLFANGTLTITKVHLTVTADNKSKAYNGSPFTAFTVTITGFVNGETVAVVSGSATYTGTAVGATLPGAYTITPQLGTLSATNYDFPGPSPGTYFVNGTLTIGYGTCTGSDPGGVILPPINNDGSSVYKRKAGSTIPVKFKVCDANGNSISDPNVVFQTGCCGSVNMTSRMRGTVESVNEAGETSIPDVAFRYTGDHWQFNMDSGNLDAGYTYTFVITLKYGSIQFVIATK